MSQALARALALFDDCVAMSPAARTALLDDLARRDPDAHRALRALLASDDALQEVGERALLPDISLDLLASPARASALPDAGADARVGSRLGPWRIERLLSSGGMGTVYEAWRDDGQYRQRVALKCIRRELTSPRLIESFRREREALAALDHPGIATLLDGGIEADGHPWFAMRYVQGAQIDAWCDARQIGLRQRVALLVQVCDALVYAHQRLVLHQDIKPSNLMVTDTGQVQVLDFGLTASLAIADTAPRLAASDSYTAPEALSGAIPAVTMDIWSMGVLMYSLLGGALPHASGRLLSTVLTQDEGRAPLLSQLAGQGTAANAQARGFDTPAALSRALSGDLDAIAARCVARESAHRYGSIAALRDDLTAWLQQRPVQARNGGLLYRGGRLLARHRLVASLALLAVLITAGSTGVVVWQEHRAARETASSLALSQVFERMLGHATLSGLGDTPMSSRLLLEDTERQVRALPLQEHPVVLARGLSMLARNYSVVGDFDHATQLAQEAAALQGGDPAARAAAQATLASLLNLQGKPAEAGQAAASALAGAGVRGHVDVRLQLLTELARSQWDLTEQDRARATLDQALALAHDAGNPVPEAELLTLRGHWRMRLIDFAGADADFARAIALASPTHPLVAGDTRILAAQSLLVQERTTEGLLLIEHLVADYRNRLGNDHALVGRALRVQANLQCAGGQLEACATTIAHAERIVRQQYGEKHPEFAEILRVRSFLQVFGQNPSGEDLALLRRAQAVLSASYPEGHYTVLRARFMYGRRLVVARTGTDEVRARRTREAIETMESVIAGFAKARLPLQPLHRITLAQALMMRRDPGDLARARRLLEDNADILQAYPPGYSMRFYNPYLLARAAYDDGDAAAADAQLATLVAPLRQQLTTTNNRFVLRDVLMLRARIALDRGDDATARDLLAQAVAHMEAAFGPDHVGTGRTRAALSSLRDTGTFALLN